jgi:hypothetical protein
MTAADVSAYYALLDATAAPVEPRDGLAVERARERIEAAVEALHTARAVASA